MKFFFLLIIPVLILSGCSDKSAEDKPSTEIKTSAYSKIEKLFKEFNADTLYVSGYWEEDPNQEFKGIIMDSLQVSALPYDLRERYRYFKEFAACYKFPLAKSKTALIIRVPGEYSSTALELLIFDLEKDSVTETLFLADTFGDAGETASTESCIFKDPQSNFFVLTYFESSSREIDATSDSLDEHKYEYALFDLSETPFKTVSKDSATLVSGYPEIIKNLSGE